MPRILLVRPGPADRAGFSAAAAALGHELSFYDGAGAVERPDQALLELLELCKGFSGLLSAEPWPGGALAAAAAHHRRLPGPRPEALLRLLHGVEAQRLLARQVAEAAPEARAVDPSRPGEPPFPFPFLVRPAFASGEPARRVERRRDWEAAVREAAWAPERYAPANAFLKRYGRLQGGAELVLAEPLPEGEPFELDGFVSGNEVRVLGLPPPETGKDGREVLIKLLSAFARLTILGLDLDQACFSLRLSWKAGFKGLRLLGLRPCLKPGPGAPYAAALQLSLGQAPG